MSFFLILFLPLSPTSEGEAMAYSSAPERDGMNGVCCLRCGLWTAGRGVRAHHHVHAGGGRFAFVGSFLNLTHEHE